MHLDKPWTSSTLYYLQTQFQCDLITCLYVQEPVQHDQPVSTVEAADSPGHGAGRAAGQGRLRRQEAAEYEKGVEDGELDQVEEEKRELFSLRKNIYFIKFR